MTPEEKAQYEQARARFEEMRNNLDMFAAANLKVRAKGGELVRFTFNGLQEQVHRSAEEQKKRTGMVRQIVLKFRRGGASTYIASRGYHKASMNTGVSVAIMAHKSDSTNGLYEIVKRFQDNNPLAPPLKKSNVKGLEFESLDSRYNIYSAENTDQGLGRELTFLHISEAAAINNLNEHMATIGNCVSEVPGTEIWIEGTARGPVGEFFERCMDTINGASDYVLSFVPFNVDGDCSVPVPDGFKPRSERDDENIPSETELMELHGLTLGQIAWRRRKIVSTGSIVRFVQEFPLTIQDAFMASASEESMFSASDVVRAQKAKKEPTGAVIMGVDPASMGGDRFCVALRQGRKVLWVKSRTKVKVTEGIEWVRSLIDEHKPDRVNIDAAGGGNGDAISSALKEDSRYASVVRAVNFGGTSQAKLARPEKPGPINRRAEMYERFAKEIASEEGLDIPDETAISADLMKIERKMVNLEGDWRLKSKKEMKGRSPDMSDAIALTFADRYVRSDRIAEDAMSNRTGGQIAGVPRIAPKALGWMA